MTHERIGAYLRNRETGRFHPLVYRPAPLPGGAKPQGADRYRTLGHHTNGYDSFEEAQSYFTKDAPHVPDTGIIYDWDGTTEGGAMTMFFPDDLGVVPYGHRYEQPQ